MNTQHCYRFFCVFSCLGLLGVGLPDCKEITETCETAADTVAQAAVRCGPKNLTKEQEITLFSTAKADFIEKITYGTCEFVMPLPDLKVLLAECLYWYEKAPCNKINEQKHPACASLLEQAKEHRRKLESSSP